MTLTEVSAILLEKDDFAVITHRRPDGDTLGSAAALCSALRRAGKRAYILPNPEITERYAPVSDPFMAPPGFAGRFAVAVDVADVKLFPESFEGAVDLCIDHHPSNTRYAGALFLRTNSASCAQIVLELIEIMHGTVTKEEADALYVGLSTDTGCFMYSNTDAAAHTAAAKLIEAGADAAALNHLYFRTFTASRLALEGKIMSTLRFGAGGRIVVACVTLDMISAVGATEDDCDDLAALAGKVKGCEIAVTVRQLTEDHCKVSVRTNGTVNASDICRRFGGGGHPGAAGCELDGSPDRVCAVLAAAAAEFLP